MSDHRIILSDCLGPEGLATLPDSSVDVVLTDPPYSAHVHAGNARTNAKAGSDAKVLEIPFSPLSIDVRREVAGHFARIARRWVLLFCDDDGISGWAADLEGAGLEHVRTGVWVRGSTMPQVRGDRPAVGHETIVIAHHPGRKRWNGGGKAGVWAEARAGLDGVRHHPTEKPLALMESLVRDFTDPGELICDPFAGSGTTGVAAKRLGRRFIGWERDPKYHAIAQKRIDGAREQLGLFRERQPKPKQETLLGVDDHG